jgi:hypothetical protein
MGNFHFMEIILTCRRVPFQLCKLLFLQHHYDFSEHDFFSPMKDSNIQRKKNVTIGKVYGMGDIPKIRGWIWLSPCPRPLIWALPYK